MSQETIPGIFVRKESSRERYIDYSNDCVPASVLLRGESERPSWELRGFYPCRPVPVSTGPRPVSTYSKTHRPKQEATRNPGLCNTPPSGPSLPLVSSLSLFFSLSLS